ncbi:hypothetical protein EM595_1391 [Duffyella gerundensis]|uniref:Uncharacterized protein n=1 Tax=Duffyella gerundensis TaxID=1619313 RepID=A0A0U5KZ45_9GAMM|nr:hypothetical protein EM595_1391 [Duffyella gerundensis]
MLFIIFSDKTCCCVSVRKGAWRNRKSDKVDLF